MRSQIAAALFTGVAAIGMFSASASADITGAPASAKKVATETLVRDYQQDLNLVTPGDPFTIAVTAFTATAGAQATSPLTSNFGTTQTFAGAGLNGQAVTVTSSESIGATTTTDTITISVPNDFLPAGTTLGGAAPTSIFVEIGNENTVAAGGTPNPVNFLLPISHPAGYSDQFTIRVGTSTLGPFTFTETVSAGNTALAGFGGVANGGASVAGLGINTFTVTFSYPNVPEPTSLGVIGLAGAAMLRRRRRATRIAK